MFNVRLQVWRNNRIHHAHENTSYARSHVRFHFSDVPIRNYSLLGSTGERCPATICQRSARLTNTTVILSSGWA
jgi:hypothetical protein